MGILSLIILIVIVDVVADILLVGIVLYTLQRNGRIDLDLNDRDGFWVFTKDMMRNWKSLLGY